MHMLISFFWTILQLFGSIISIFVAYIFVLGTFGALKEVPGVLREVLKQRANPRCISCGRRRLKRYDFFDLDAPEAQYYGCKRCYARFKRLPDGETVTFPRGTGTIAESKERLIKPTSVMLKPRGLRWNHEEPLVEEPLGSWFGSVQVALPGEEWPEYDGVPMLPLCQLRCESIPVRPAVLDNIALVCVFVASVGEETVSRQGEKWVLRTYTSLDGLVPIAYPGDVVGIRACPVGWRVADDTPHNPLTLPEELWFDFEDYVDGHGRCGARASKVGGHGWVTEDEALSSQNSEAEFVFQIDVWGNFPWLRGPGGTFCFTCSTTEVAENWFVNYRPIPPENGSHIMTVRLGCELEGLQIELHELKTRSDYRGGSRRYREFRMSYQGRSSRIYHLDDLCGLVRITTPEMALQFVRLRTCQYLRDFDTGEYEILTQKEYDLLPEWNHVYAQNPLYGKVMMSRFIMGPKTFALHGFEPAQVEPIEGGFRITRWTYHSLSLGDMRHEYEASFLKIVETVMSDGTYTRTVLMQRPKSDDELLRPTTGPDETDPNELLRPEPHNRKSS